MYKVYSINIKGKEKRCNFTFWADSNFINDWLDDGLDINEVSLPRDDEYVFKTIEALRNSS